LLNENLRKRSHKFRVSGRFEGLRIGQQPVLEVELAGRARLVEAQVLMPLNLGYGDPEASAESRDLVLQKAASGATGVAVLDRSHVATVVDLANLELPPNSQLRYVRVEAPKTMDMASFELLDPRRLRMSSGPMTVIVVSQSS